MKKKWYKPELLVLYRGKPEENLLTKIYCKMTNPKNLPDNAAGVICAWNTNVQCDLHSAS